MISPKHSVSVAGVILNDDGKILIIQRADNSEWQIPGGVLELNESFSAGLKREILEETSIEVDVLKLTGVYKNLVVGVVALVFKCKYLGGEPSISNETKQVKWMSFEQAQELLSKTFKTRVADSMSSSDIAFVRTHDGINFIDEI